MRVDIILKYPFHFRMNNNNNNNTTIDLICARSVFITLTRAYTMYDNDNVRIYTTLHRRHCAYPAGCSRVLLVNVFTLFRYVAVEETGSEVQLAVVLKILKK